MIKVKAVLFDLDGVLYNLNKLYCLMAIGLLKAVLAHPVRTVEQIRIIIHYRRAQEWLRKNQDAGLPADAQIERAVSTLRLPKEKVKACIDHWMGRVPLRLVARCVNQSLVRMMYQWHDLGIPMGVYSDYPVHDKLEALGLGSFFTVVLASTDPEVMALKPCAKGFQIAAGRFGLPAADIAYVGDRYETDTIGARNSGMRPIMIGRDIQLLDLQIRRVYGTKCWVCGSTSTRTLRPSSIAKEIDSRSIRISDSSYGKTAALAQCCECGFIFADPLPHANLTDLYGDMVDVAYVESSSARRVQMRRIIDAIVRAYPQTKSILDVGAGTGLLVSESRKKGFRVDGVEPSHWCVDIARRINGVDLFCGTLETSADKLGEYDSVVLIDVIEHLGDPMRLLSQALDRLSAKGVLVIVTPDVGSKTANLMGKNWWHYRTAHVGYFNRRAMNFLLNKFGLEVVSDRLIGWRFSAAYIGERLAHYAVLPAIEKFLRRLFASRAIKNVEVDLNLFDSRMYIARRKRCNAAVGVQYA
jgi:FMN phosphatase YigB (HAD superfamily)/SAM-dependent methyltransferase